MFCGCLGMVIDLQENVLHIYSDNRWSSDPSLFPRKMEAILNYHYTSKANFLNEPLDTFLLMLVTVTVWCHGGFFIQTCHEVKRPILKRFVWHTFFILRLRMFNLENTHKSEKALYMFLPLGLMWVNIPVLPQIFLK